MSKSKQAKMKFDNRFNDDEYDDWGVSRDERRKKISEKRIKAAIKSKNLNRLIEDLEEDF